ncbi:hypothetical protein GIB67_025799 [Kingdonia uniflora]|uniref:Uncharacterized protein n=1 Tax=Kingdonia uniflora TaxID=39325 RepID=A0A7J7NST7_9MAGN|nr:hypothetical protein GIB67_025799 [Kingdonia uniflora]
MSISEPKSSIFFFAYPCRDDDLSLFGLGHSCLRYGYRESPVHKDIYAMIDDVLKLIGEEPRKLHPLKELYIRLKKLDPFTNKPEYLFLICSQLLSKLRKFIDYIHCHQKTQSGDPDFEDLRSLTVSFVHKINQNDRWKELLYFMNDEKEKEDAIAKNPDNFLNFIYGNADSGFNYYVTEKTEFECKNNIRVIADILHHHPHLVTNLSDLGNLISRNQTDNIEGRRDCLVYFIDQIDVGKLATSGFTKEEKRKPPGVMDLNDLSVTERHWVKSTMEAAGYD